MLSLLIMQQDKSNDNDSSSKIRDSKYITIKTIKIIMIIIIIVIIITNNNNYNLTSIIRTAITKAT
jgi:hypothetical protein